MVIDHHNSSLYLWVGYVNVIQSARQVMQATGPEFVSSLETELELAEAPYTCKFSLKRLNLVVQTTRTLFLDTHLELL